MTRTVYYLTGMNGRLSTGLGEALLSRGVDVIGSLGQNFHCAKYGLSMKLKEVPILNQRM